MKSGSINWLGDVVVPIGTLVISTLFALWLAQLTRRRAILDRRWERDRQVADSVIESLARLEPWHLVVRPQPDMGETLAKLQIDFGRFRRTATHGNAIRWRFYAIHSSLLALWQKASHLNPQGPEDADLEDAEFAKQLVNEAIEIMQAWPDPRERKRVILRTYEIMLPETTSAFDNYRGFLPKRLLQADYLSVDMMPTSAAAYHLLRGWIWLQCAFYTVLRGRFRDFVRFREEIRSREKNPMVMREVARNYATVLAGGLALDLW